MNVFLSWKILTKLLIVDSPVSYVDEISQEIWEMNFTITMHVKWTTARSCRTGIYGRDTSDTCMLYW